MGVKTPPAARTAYVSIEQIAEHPEAWYGKTVTAHLAGR